MLKENIYTCGKYDLKSFISKHKLPELRQLCKQKKLKQSGNKKAIVDRIITHVEKINACCIIQRLFRGYIVRKYIACKGKINDIINRDDFLTFESLSEIPFHQRFVYCENGKYMYGFNIISILSIFKQNPNQIKNPYTRNFFPISLYTKLCQHVRFGRILGYIINTDHVSDDTFHFEHHIASACCLINEHGYQCEVSWFCDLTTVQMIRFIRELYDLWIYRLHISHEMKKKIVFPNGNPFRDIRIQSLSHYTNDAMKEKLFIVIKKLLQNGVDQEYRGLGCLYVLTALTLVSRECADTLPWLYESVRY